MLKYKNNLEIIDLETGEILDLDYFARDIVNLEFDELVQRIIVLKTLYTKLASIYRINELKFINMMEEKHAKKFTNEDIEIRLTPQTDYIYDVNYIHKIHNIIGDDEFNKVFTEQYKVNRTMLRSIYTLGGDIKEYIDKMETKIQKKPTITIKNKNN